MKLILASNNANKLREFREMTSGMDIELISQKEAGCNFEVEETGTTFEENAYLKAAAVTKFTGLPAVADDSGIEVDALGGRPGVYSARYAADIVNSDAEKNDYLLNEIGDNPNRNARYVCSMCCTFPNGDRITSRGECEGEVYGPQRGNGGFGYDPIFTPKGYEKRMAELTPDEKNAISHRGKAMRAFVSELEEYLKK